MKLRGSLFNKILLFFILLSLIPTLLTSVRLLSLNRSLLRVGGTLANGAFWNIPEEAIVQVNDSLRVELISYLIYTGMGIGIIAIFSSAGLLGPIRQLQRYVERLRAAGVDQVGAAAGLAAGDDQGSRPGVALPELAESAQLLPRTGDEVESLATSFQNMASDMFTMQHNLQNQVNERTQTMEHRARQLQAAAQVAQVASTIRDIDQLLNKVTQLISEYFGYYHAGIFLMEGEQENQAGDHYAVLRASNSEGGQKMLARGHRLAVSETSIVGTVADTRRPRLAMDVGDDAVHFRNPFLPKTRSELALPLLVGDRLWGVLDVQSEAEAAFSEDDIATLQILANQIAISIENANLFLENQAIVADLRAALDISRKAYGELSREAWRKLLQVRPMLGYLSSAPTSSTGSEVTAITGDWHPKMLELLNRAGAFDYAAAEEGAASEIAQDGSEHRRAETSQQQEKPSGQRALLTTSSDQKTLFMPIVIRQAPAGVLRLQKPAQAPPWSQTEIELIQTLSDQLSVALESARLYEETRRRAERERLTGEITARMRTTNNPQAILETAVKELRRALQASQAQVSITPPITTTPTDVLYPPDVQYPPDAHYPPDDSREGQEQ
ncbi:MAG: GAF domain-containing protein [Anaerolineales bacterium]|nr:GAF domain-containing protein [Anaerolineales bacterium]